MEASLRSKSPPHREKEYIVFGMDEASPEIDSLLNQTMRVVTAKCPQRAASKALTRLVPRNEKTGVVLIETHQEEANLVRPRARRTIHAYTVDWSLKGPQSCRVATPTDEQTDLAQQLKNRYVESKENRRKREDEDTGNTAREEYSAAAALLHMRRKMHEKNQSPQSPQSPLSAAQNGQE